MCGQVMVAISTCTRYMYVSYEHEYLITYLLT